MALNPSSRSSDKSSKDNAKDNFSDLDTVALDDFHGGIHPPQQKLPAATNELLSAAIPATLFYPLPVNGSDLELHCKAGDKVLKGQILASDKQQRQPPIHASTSGEICAIEKIPSSHPSAIAIPMLVLKSDGEDRFIDTRPSTLEDILTTPVNNLIDKIFAAGIIGMGGAGFPTATKLKTAITSTNNNKLAVTLLLNGAECEPYISCDDKLMQTEPDKILKGALILAYCLGADNIQIAVEDNKPEAISCLRQARDLLAVKVAIISIPTKYPSGGEKQLIEIITGQQVPVGKFPADLGITVQNLATTTAVYNALVEDIPLIERIVTVTGKNLKQPANYKVLLGTTVSDVLLQAGLDLESKLKHHQSQQLILGGPMMGHNLRSTATPILKTTNCIIAPSSDEFPIAPETMACIRCGLCTEVCPADLLPQQLYWHSRAEEWDKAEQLNLKDCIECGACSFVCPSHIPLVEYYRFAKDTISNKHQEKLQIEAARERHQKRQLRLDRLQQEKADRRKQKAAEAAMRKQQRVEEDGFSEATKKQSVADAVARVKAKKQQKAEAILAEQQQNNRLRPTPNQDDS